MALNEKPTTIAPDGVLVQVRWDDLVVGASVFIPCINTKKAVQQVKAIARKRGITVECVNRIESCKWGVRVWRTS